MMAGNRNNFNQQLMAARKKGYIAGIVGASFYDDPYKQKAVAKRYRLAWQMGYKEAQEWLKNN